MPSNSATCLRIAETCALFNLRGAARSVARLYEPMLATAGLTGPQFAILVALGTRGGWTMTRLSDAVSTERTTLTRNAARMRRAGLIRLDPGRDRRSRLVQITPAGRRALARAVPPWREAQRRLAAAIGARRMARLIGELRSVASRLPEA